MLDLKEIRNIFNKQKPSTKQNLSAKEKKNAQKKLSTSKQKSTMGKQKLNAKNYKASKNENSKIKDKLIVFKDKLRNIYSTSLGRIRRFFDKDNLKNLYSTSLSKMRSIFNKDNLKSLYSISLSKMRSIFNKDNIRNFISVSKDNIKNIPHTEGFKNLTSPRNGIAVAVMTFFLVSGMIITNSRIPVATKPFVLAQNNAEVYYYSAKYEEALKAYDEMAIKTGNEPVWDVDKAEIYSVKQDYENSRKYLALAKDKIKESKKLDAELTNRIAFIEFMNKDFELALQDGEEALKTSPKNKNIIKTMFTIYMGNNQIEKATTLIESYNVDTKSPYELAEYARMLMIVNKWDDGFRILKDAWDMDRDEMKVYDVLAQISVYNRDFLLQSVSTLAEANPNVITYKMWLAKIYSLSEETADQAQAILDSVPAYEQGKITPKLIKLQILQNTHNEEEVGTMIYNLSKDYEKDYRVLHTIGWYYVDKKDFDMALKYCNRSILANKDYPDNYAFLMPEILKGQKKDVEGEPYFRKALCTEPYNYNIMLNVANYYWYTTKNSDRALEYFKFAEIVKPQDAEIKYNMANIHLSNNRINEAIELLKQCISIDDMVPKYHRTLGTIYLQQGKNTEGIKEIRYAYSGDQQDILTLNNAGCYYVTIDQNLDRAMTNFQAALNGIRPTTDQYTASTIKENYSKFKSLYDKVQNSPGNETVKIPEFVLFY